MGNSISNSTGTDNMRQHELILTAELLDLSVVDIIEIVKNCNMSDIGDMVIAANRKIVDKGYVLESLRLKKGLETLLSLKVDFERGQGKLTVCDTQWPV